MNFKIDPEIESLLPKLTREEYAKLSLLIELHGQVDPLVVLNVNGVRLLGDGHNRLRICQEKRLKYTTREIKFPTRDLAIQWVIDNQLGRRNLTDERRAYYVGKEYLNKKQQHGGQMPGSGQNVQTSKELAEKHNVSEKTIRRDAEFAEAVDRIGEADPQAKEEILSGQSGQTKAEVIKTLRPSSGRTKRAPKKPRAGSILFDWKEWHADFGRLIRSIDVFERAYHCKDTPQAESLRRLLGQFREEFRAWAEFKMQEKPPD